MIPGQTIKFVDADGVAARIIEQLAEQYKIERDAYFAEILKTVDSNHAARILDVSYGHISALRERGLLTRINDPNNPARIRFHTSEVLALRRQGGYKKNGGSKGKK